MTERRTSPLAVIVLVGILLFTSLMVTIIVSMAIWPGEATLTAPILCDDARPDAYVVRDTYSYRPGETSMTFTLYCLGPRGDYDEIGWMSPTLVLWFAHTVLILALVIVAILFLRMRRSRRAINAPPESASPFAASG